MTDTAADSCSDAVESTLPPSPSSSADSSTSSKKSVTFVPGDDCRGCNVTYHPGACATTADIDMLRKDIWYQHSDLQHIKRKAMVVSKEAHRYGFGSLLTNTYGNSDNNSNETQQALNMWVSNGNNRRGLERWINDEYAAKRADIRRRTIQSVLRAQTKMMQEGLIKCKDISNNNNNNNNNTDAATTVSAVDNSNNDYDYASKVMARLSEAFSIDSRNFARAMGIADELAASQANAAESTDTCNVSSDKLHHATKLDSARRGLPSVSSRSLGLGARGHPKQHYQRRLVVPGGPKTAAGSSAEFRHFY